MATVVLEDTTRTYPKGDRAAVDHLNLDIADGEFVVLVGPSGCGKTTSLRMVAGLEDVDEGSIRIGGKEVVGLPPRARDIAMVFQSYALYPHMNVAQNMGFALKIAGLPKDEIRARVEEAARILDLDSYLDRKPARLSGGQRQRVAMGRAIVRQPQVFLMDEPLSNLDAKLRVATRAQISALQRRLGVTTLYVTHDQVEAMTMGDRVAVMKDGVLQQCDKPRVLYDEPVNAFVAGFIGSPAMNLIDGVVSVGGVTVGGVLLPLPEHITKRAGAIGATVTVGLRPESLELTSEADGVPAIVNIVEELGADAYLYAQIGNEVDRSVTATSDVVARIGPRTVLDVGSRVHLRVKPQGILLFGAETGERI